MESNAKRQRLSPEAARAKYLYNKKYQDSYWERRAKREGENATERKAGASAAVELTRESFPDTEAYIKALEGQNAALWRVIRESVAVYNGIMQNQILNQQ